METVDLKTRLGRPLAQFGIFPKLPPSLFHEQYELVKEAAHNTGFLFYFVVTTDEICGWKIGEPSPVFRQPTKPILGRYARHPEDVHSALGEYLGALVEAWIDDLASRWKSSQSQPPAEQEFKDLGLLQHFQLE